MKIKLKELFLKNKILTFAFIVVILLDKLTKHWIKIAYLPGESHNVIGNFFKITFIENEGIAFGLFSDWNHPLKALFLLVLSIIALVFILHVYHRSRKTFLVQLSFGLILGGAFGNIYDRLIYRRVVDFFNFGIGEARFPFFNIADSSITIGVILIMLLTVFKKEDI